MRALLPDTEPASCFLDAGFVVAACTLHSFATKQEIKGFFEKTNSLKNKIGSMQTRLLMKLFPRRFEAKILKSANEPYKSTNKNNNVW